MAFADGSVLDLDPGLGGGSGVSTPVSAPVAMDFGASGLIGGGLGLLGDVINVGFQREVFEYQQDLNEQIFERDDTAIRRRIADLRAAGLNPALALGQSAGNSGTVRAPTATKLSMDNVAQVMSMMVQDAQIGHVKAQDDLIRAQAEKVRTETDVLGAAEGRASRKFEVELAQLVLNRDYLRDTMKDRMDEQQARSWIANFNWRASQIDVMWKEQLIEFLSEDEKVRGVYGDVPRNPLIMEALAARMALQIKENDYGIYKKLGMPSQGSTGALATGAMSNLHDQVSDLPREAWKMLIDAWEVITGGNRE